MVIMIEVTVVYTVSVEAWAVHVKAIVMELMAHTIHETAIRFPVLVVFIKGPMRKNKQIVRPPYIH